MFDTILIANRGEIACRVAATAHRMGIRTVAVYSDADANARHVQMCDEAVHLGAAEPSASYLRGDAILQAALQTGAQAIHPGYGFLSENADFARACAAAGIAFIGPPATAIAAMGSKSAAKALMASAAVPLVPGYHGDDQDAGLLQAKAREIEYPVLIKASAGGGGKGMRIVQADAEFASALASCKREAASSFGNDQVLVERYLAKPRHIEIQVFADSHGNCVYLFERDCSIQRRYQKVIEEAPAPGMTPERRQAMGEAAVAAAQAVGYVGAGTVEFIVEPDGRFYFMEMNTRLQVEHPVTEAITGQDLVEWQLRVAAGEPLPLKQEQLSIRGHALEARIYAENPDNDFLPSIGHLDVLRWPEHASFTLGDVRVDGGIREGDTITPYYDPMVAKLIVYGDDREQARQRMLRALAAVRCTGVHTNIAFLARLMANQAFAAADLDTGFIEREHASLFPATTAVPATVLAIAAAAILSNSNAGAAAPLGDPWAITDCWRLGGSYERELKFAQGENEYQLTLQHKNAVWQLRIGDEPAASYNWQVAAATPQSVRVQLGQADVRGDVYIKGLHLDVFVQGQRYGLQWLDALSQASAQSDVAAGGLSAPMPGKILSVAIEAGDVVAKGDALIVMEAMKMEHTIEAPFAGMVKEILYVPGDQVQEGDALIVMEAAE